MRDRSNRRARKGDVGQDQQDGAMLNRASRPCSRGRICEKATAELAMLKREPLYSKERHETRDGRRR